LTPCISALAATRIGSPVYVHKNLAYTPLLFCVPISEIPRTPSLFNILTAHVASLPSQQGKALRITLGPDWVTMITDQLIQFLGQHWLPVTFTVILAWLARNRYHNGLNKYPGPF
jgi:hypothetical protein